jgi:hypothetical protein
LLPEAGATPGRMLQAIRCSALFKETARDETSYFAI